MNEQASQPGSHKILEKKNLESGSMNETKLAKPEARSKFHAEWISVSHEWADIPF